MIIGLGVAFIVLGLFGLFGGVLFGAFGIGSPVFGGVILALGLLVLGCGIGLIVAMKPSYEEIAAATEAHCRESAASFSVITSTVISGHCFIQTPDGGVTKLW